MVRSVSSPALLAGGGPFFVLSGFVLARVYEPRFAAGMTARQFVLQRFIRLWPLFAIGVSIGAIVAILKLFTHQNELTPLETAMAFTANLAILPSPTWWASNSLFPLDRPGWSLFFELLVNLFFVLIWRRLNRLMLGLVIGGAALWLLLLYLGGTGFGGTGWDNILNDFPRVTYSFFVGVVIARVRTDRSIQTPLAWLIPIIIVPLLFSSSRWNAEIDLLLVFFGLPALVYLGSLIEPRSSFFFEKAGVLSYPLYAVHEPTLVLFVGVAAKFGLTLGAGAPWSGLAFLIMMVAVSLFLDRYYDMPVRRWLMRRFAKEPRQAQSSAENARPL